MDDPKIHNIIPNTTQIPHIIIREWMWRLKDVEFRILLVVADQTIGWIEDQETGRRKEKDWIAHAQLIKKTGRSDRAISAAVKKLVDHLGIVEAYDEGGNPLDTPEKRMKCGDKILYRLNLKPPQPTLFDTPAKSAGVRKKQAFIESKPLSTNFFTIPPQILRAQILRATKETILTKDISRTAKPPALKPKRTHAQLVQFWHEAVQATRGIKPIITKADARNLKRVLDLAALTQTEIEQLAVYFLASPHFLTFSPSISTFLSAGILNGLMNRMRNAADFWRELDSYTARYLRKPTQTDSRNTMAERLEALKKALFREPFTPAERSAIQEEAAAGERAAKS